MQAGNEYMERHNQVERIAYRNICAKYGLAVLKSKWEISPKVVQNDRANVRPNYPCLRCGMIFWKCDKEDVGTVRA